MWRAITIVGVDLYNNQLTGDVSMTFGGARADQHNVPHAIVIGVDLYNKSLTGDVSKTLNAIRSDSDHTPVIISIDMGGGKSNCIIGENISPTLTTTHYGEPVVAYEKERNSKENSV